MSITWHQVENSDILISNKEYNNVRYKVYLEQNTKSICYNQQKAIVYKEEFLILKLASLSMLWISARSAHVY